MDWTIDKLKKKASYKAYVRAWVMKSGKKTYILKSPEINAYTSGSKARYTTAKRVTVNKQSVHLKKGRTYKIKAGVTKLYKSKKLIPASHAAKLRYLSSNKKVATVRKAGRIKAKKKGTCYIYAYAPNGVFETMEVVVE